jgi:hypothetical protein
MCDELAGYAPVRNFLGAFPAAMKGVLEAVEGGAETVPDLRSYGQVRLFATRIGMVVPNIVVGVKVPPGSALASPPDKVNVKGLGHVAVVYYVSPLD